MIPKTTANIMGHAGEHLPACTGGQSELGITNEGGIMKEGGIGITDEPHPCLWNLQGTLSGNGGGGNEKGQGKSAVEMARGATVSSEVGRGGQSGCWQIFMWPLR